MRCEPSRDRREFVINPRFNRLDFDPCLVYPSDDVSFEDLELSFERSDSRDSAGGVVVVVDIISLLVL